MTEPTLGMKIRTARERRRWTQQKLAEALGVGLRTVSDWENDRALPRSSIGAIEDVLGIQIRPAAPADAETRMAASFRRMLEDHGPDVDLSAQDLDELTALFVRLRRARGAAASGGGDSS